MEKVKKPKVSYKTLDKIYSAVHHNLTELRIELKGNITSKVDYNIAQVEHKIWKDIKKVLGVVE